MAEDGLVLRSVARDGTVTGMFSGIPCKLPGSSDGHLAPGESIGKTLSGSVRAFLPAGAVAGSYTLRLDYITADRQGIGPRVSGLVRTP